MTKTVSVTEYEKVLNEISGIDLSEVSYLTDRIIVFYAGKKINTPISKEVNDNITEENYEYELWLDGDWDYFKNKKLVETSKVKKSEDRKGFTKRMFSFEDSFKPKMITKITISSNGLSAEVTLDDRSYFRVSKDEEMFVHIYRRSITDGVYNTHSVDIDEDTHELRYFENTKTLVK